MLLCSERITVQQIKGGSMPIKKLLLWILVFTLLLSVVGCSLITTNNASNQAENQNNNLGNTNKEDNNSQPEVPLETEPEPKPKTDAVQLPEFNTAEPCSIVPSEVAETVLGQPVEAIEGPGNCVYSTGSASITISVLEGEAAKLSMADQILQLETDCSMSFSYSSDQPDPTPLPPEADPLLAMSMQMLMEQSLTLQQSCGGYEFETLSEYGPGVYLLPFELFMPGGQVSITTAEFTLTILFIDMEQDSTTAVEVARQILEMLVTEK
jgi:hypothetical protein